MRDAADNLALATDFPGAESINWKLDELISETRLATRRTQDSAVSALDPTTSVFQRTYHRSSSSTQTGTATPLATDSPKIAIGVPRSSKNQSDSRKKSLLGPLTSATGTIGKRFNSRAAATGQLRWNPREVFAVAIDGQHRLAAIQELGNPTGGQANKFEKTMIPVILLVLDDRLGYDSPEGHPLVEVLRNIFIDLNKHAQVVSRARQIFSTTKTLSVSVFELLSRINSRTTCRRLENDPTAPALESSRLAHRAGKIRRRSLLGDNSRHRLDCCPGTRHQVDL